jgi:uncharacterized membrane protein
VRLEIAPDRIEDRAPERMCRGAQWVLAGTGGFVLENLVLSDNRTELIDAFGEAEYHMGYSLLSTLACGSVAYGYIRFRTVGPTLAPPGSAAKLGAIVFQSLGLAGLLQLVPKLQSPVGLESARPVHAAHQSEQLPSTHSTPVFVARCPVDFRAKDSPQDVVHGLQRVSRHATFWSLGFIGLGSALVSVYPTTVCLGLMPSCVAVILGAHMDYRYRRNRGGSLPPEVEEQTSLLPFAALLMGENSWGLLWAETKHTNAALGCIVAAALHARRSRVLQRVPK